MTEKENALIALRGGKPEWVPCYFGITALNSPYAGERKTRGVKEGYDEYGVRWIATASANAFTPGSPVSIIIDECKTCGSHK